MTRPATPSHPWQGAEPLTPSSPTGQQGECGLVLFKDRQPECQLRLEPWFSEEDVYRSNDGWFILGPPIARRYAVDFTAGRKKRGWKIFVLDPDWFTGRPNIRVRTERKEVRVAIEDAFLRWFKEMMEREKKSRR